MSNQCALAGHEPVRLDDVLNTHPSARSTFAFLDLFDGAVEHLVQVAHDPKISKSEDRRLGILVHRDDGLGGLHSSTVLDGAGNASSNVQLRRNGLAGLADLVRVRIPAGVDGGREAPRPPSTSASSSISAKSPPVPRPPDTATAASVNSGRPLDCFGSLLTMRAVFAASEMVTRSARLPAHSERPRELRRLA